MFVTGDPIAGPDRRWQGTMDDAVKTRAECLRDNVRRRIRGSRNLLMETAGNTNLLNVDQESAICSHAFRGGGRVHSGKTCRLFGLTF